MTEIDSEKSFLDLASEGRGGKWSYLISVILGSIYYIVAGVILFMAFLFISTGGVYGESQIDESTGLIKNVDILLQYIAINLSISPILVWVLLVTKFFHNRPIISLISATGKIRWSLVRQGFVVWLVLSVISLIFEFFFYPSNIIFSLKPEKFFMQLPVVLLITPIQTSTEELFFRGYILQAQAFITKNIWVLAFFNGLLFLVPHMLNTEMKDYQFMMTIIYFGIGFFLAYITVKTNGMEAALGAHAANNLFGLLVSFKKSSLPLESVFQTKEMHPVTDTISFIIMAIVFCFVISKFYSQDRLKSDSDQNE